MIDFNDKDRQTVELISDDFQSTFSIAGSNTLVNMMHEKDQVEVIRIIHKHLGDVKITFTKMNYFNGDEYDMYGVLIEEN